MSGFEGTPSPPQCGLHKWKPLIFLWVLFARFSSSSSSCGQRVPCPRTDALLLRSKRHPHAPTKKVKYELLNKCVNKMAICLPGKFIGLGDAYLFTHMLSGSCCTFFVGSGECILVRNKIVSVWGYGTLCLRLLCLLL